MTLPLQGRRVLVTGGATGIGAAAVQALSEAGAAVVATYHRTPPPERDGVSWLQCDVRDSAAVNEMVKAAAETLDGLDVLLHAAGMWQAGIPGQLTDEDIDFLIDTNLKATIFANQAAYGVMRRNGGGRIINFGSAEAVMGSPISALYATTKGAVQAWTRSIAKAWAADNVTAVALAPAVKTPGADRLREFLGPEAAELIDQQIKATIPLGGALGDPSRDLGPVLMFLAGEGSRFITGQLIAVDGGLMMLGAWVADELRQHEAPPGGQPLCPPPNDNSLALGASLAAVIEHGGRAAWLSCASCQRVLSSPNGSAR